MKIISKNGKKVLVISKKEWKQVGHQYRFAMDLPDPEQIRAVIDIVEKLNQELNGLSQATSAYKFVPEKKKTLEINKNLRDFLGLAERMRKASSEGKMSRKAEKYSIDFEQALKKIPDFICGSYDPLSHKTVDDLYYLAQHEIDLYEEDEETDIENVGQLNQAKRYLKMLKPEGKIDKIASIKSKGMSDEEMIEKFKQFADYGEANKKGIKEEDVDAKELEMGIEVEYEHTIDKEISKRIAMDHLAELKDYYSRLKKMEEEGKNDGAGVE